MKQPLPTQQRTTLLSGICTLILVMGLARFSYTPMLSYMKTGADVGEALAGWLAGWNYLGYFIGVLLIPFLKQPQAKDIIFGASLIIAAASTLLMGLTSEPVVWGISRFIAGLSTACGFILASGLMLSWLDQNNLKGELGLMYSGIGIGIFLSALLVETSSLYLGWAGQWVFLGGIGCALALPAWLWRPKFLIPKRDNKHRETTEKLISHKKQMRHHQKEPGRSWFALFQLAYLLSGFAFVIYATFMVVIIESQPGLDKFGIWAWALVGLVAAPSTFIFDLITRKLGYLRALELAFALKALALALVAVSSSMITAFLSAALFGLTFVSIVSLAMNIAGRRFPENPAHYMAILTLSYGVAQVIGPILSGQIAEETGSFKGPLFVCVGCLALGIICLEVMKRIQNRMEREPSEGATP